MAAVIAWLRENTLLAFALTAMATVLSALLAAVVTITATYLKSYLDKEISRKQSLREHHLAQLARFGALIDAIVSWDHEYLATVQHFKGHELVERVKALFARQPMFAFHPSVLMTLSSDETFADRFWSRYTALLEAHKRCS
jgi:Na+/proline symporter